MNDDFYRRQAESKQEHDRQAHAQQKHSTLETYQLEQQEANHGHLESAKGVEFTPQPSLWQRIKKMLGMS